MVILELIINIRDELFFIIVDSQIELDRIVGSISRVANALKCVGERSTFNTQFWWVNRVHYVDRHDLARWTLWFEEVSYALGVSSVGQHDVRIKALNKIRYHQSDLSVIESVINLNICIHSMSHLNTSHYKHNPSR